MRMRLGQLADEFASAGDRLASVGSALAGVDPGAAAFGAEAPGRLGEVGRLLHSQWVGALPGDILESFGAMRAAPLRAAARELRTRADGFAEGNATLAAAVSATHWQGDTSEAFDARWRALAGHLGDRAVGGDSSLAGRLAATASYVDSVAVWMDDARAAVARTLGDTLSSAEALQIRDVSISGRSGDPAGVRPEAITAAAGIAAEVL